MSSACRVCAPWIQPARSRGTSMPWRSISPKTRSAVPPANCTRRSPRCAPYMRMSSSGSYFNPGITCPPLRPDPPKPISRASSSSVSMPRSARCSAVLSPAYPPPMTSTSARAEPCSGAVSGGSAAVAAHSECDSGYGACAMMRGSLHGMQDAMQEILRARMLRLVQYIARGALLYHHAAINEQHAVGDFARKTHFVSHHDHGHALFGKLAHHAQHISHQFGIEGGGRFVEQDRLGLHGQGARDRDALLLATRQLRRMRMLLVRQPHAG